MASSSTSLSVASSSSTHPWKYEVFLSFRGEGTCKSFTDHLHEALRRYEINTFIDDQLSSGEQISSALQAIEESRFSIIIFSEHYASSSWCLDELTKILECVKVGGHTAFPVFYNVDPSHVRKQTGTYGVAFARHEQVYRDNMEKVLKWREALTAASGLSGWDSRDRHESKVIKEIVSKIWNELNDASSCNMEALVGMDSHIQNMVSLLCIGSDDVRMVGICGMAGIGKTTIAEAVYQKIHTQFEGCCFLSNVREKSQNNDPAVIQMELLSEIFWEGNLNTRIFNRGINAIKETLHSMRVLIVLDDVDCPQQLEVLAGNHNWFGPGSRIIITTREKHLLDEKVKIYEVEELNKDEARKLFYQHAFKYKPPAGDFVQLCDRALNYTKGIPLALKILGRSLYNRSKKEWESELEKLRRIPNKEIQDVPRTSFDGIDDIQKDVSLDVACFFKEENKDDVLKILNLIDKSPVTISYNKLCMHDLIQAMGREIVRQESFEDPCKRSRVYDDVCHVLQELSLRGASPTDGLRLSPLTGLNFLKKLNCNLLEGALPSDLSSLSWLECLDLSRNNFITVPASLTRLPHLRRLNLEHCKNLQSLAGLPSSSKELLANDCTSLETFSYPSSAYALRKFGDFNFEFPNCFRLMENEQSDTVEAILQEIRLVAPMQKSMVPSEHSARYGGSRYDTVVPGSSIPEWFTHQSVGDSITVELSPDCYNTKLIGMATCAVVHPKFSMGKFGRSAYFSVNESGSFSLDNTTSMRFSKADHIWFGYRLLSGVDLRDHLKVTFATSRVPAEVKKCGVRLVYEQDEMGNAPFLSAPCGREKEMNQIQSQETSKYYDTAASISRIPPVVLHDGSSSYIAFPSRRRITRGDPRRSVIYHPQGQHTSATSYDPRIGATYDSHSRYTSLGHGGFHCYEISPSVGDIYGRINVRQSGPSTHSPIRSKFTDSVENFQSDSLACRTEGESYEPKGEVGYQSIKQKMEELNRMKDLVCLFLSYPMNMVNRGIHERWVLRVLKINHKVRKIEATSKKEKIISPYASKLYSEVISLLGHSMDDIEAYVPREIIEKMCQKTLGVDKTTTIHAEVQMLSDSEEEQGKKATIHREGETLSDSDVDQGNKTTIHRVSQSDSEVEQSKKTTIHSESQTLSDSEVEQGRKTTIHRESRILCDSGVDQSQKATIHRKSEALSDSEEEQGEKASSQHDEIIPVPDDILDLAVEFAIRQILKAIENPEVRRIGISGRHGIRVTSKLKNLQQVREMFDVVVQVLASADSTINDIVENIAAQVDRLLNDTNFLILLDYIHENINLSQLGTYWWNSKNIQKIISTTRLQKVHHKMAIDLEIRMEDHLLPWELFCVNVGKVVHSSQIQGAAVDVVKRCHGHLLAIVLMGRALKEVNDVSIWKHASHALCLCPTSQMKDSILFNALAFICKQLGSKKRCVKHCALNMDKEGMDKVHLIQRWIKDGLIGTVDEGEVIVEDLLKAFLLESSQNGVSVGMRDEIREELGNLFAPVLNLGGEGLTMPPNDVSWEEADEIHLMNNELSELPYSPNCPKLRVLLLQANPFLTVIPHLFFEHMPSLQILDLSHTRIKFLPKSLSKLVKLRNFFLRSCELFMKVPPEVGELGNLEVLDFEGTEIISLPMDVGKLSKLMCLKLSFYGEDEDAGKNNRSTTIIPQNAIGKLLQLEELSIDVNPNDERWNETVKNIIKEVCSLKGLKVLKLYLPEVVLLNEFKQSEISFRSLSRFSFIVGGHLKRIISRLPRETTFEFKKQKRCLKYVNGEDIPVEIKEVLQHATALFLDRHLTLTKLSEFGIENMKELEVCVLGECKEIQTLVNGAEINKQEDNAGDVNEETVLGSLRYLSIHYMKNLRSIWEGPVQKGCLSSLKSLALHTCPQLTTIFTLDLLENLNFLEELVIENCPKINSLVTHELPAEEIQLCSIVHLPKLKKISLHYMHELVSISSGLHIAPKVEWMSFYGCPNLKTLSPMDVSSSNLKGIIGEVDWWNELTWNVQKENLDSIFVPIKGVTELMNQIAEIGDQLQH